MKKIFTSAMAGLAFTATSATAQDLGGAMYVSDSVKVMGDTEAVMTGQANAFTLMCPGYQMRNFYDATPDRAVIRLHFNTRTEFEAGIESVLSYITRENAHDFYPNFNTGLIDGRGRLTGAANTGDLLEKWEALLEGPDPVPAASLRGTDVIRRAANYAENHCFGRF